MNAKISFKSKLRGHDSSEVGCRKQEGLDGLRAQSDFRHDVFFPQLPIPVELSEQRTKYQLVQHRRVEQATHKWSSFAQKGY